MCRPNDPQSYLARAVFEPLSDPFDWLDKTIIDIDAARIASTTVDEPGGQSFEVQTREAGRSGFPFDRDPAGPEMASPAAADGIATAITGLTFEGQTSPHHHRARVSGWAYKLPEYKGAAFMGDRGKPVQSRSPNRRRSSLLDNS
ncbi:MAG: hypothetical protein WDM89_04590 [Rhizomicrobium sp.]